MNIYSEKAEERRKQFNKIIAGCDMVLMNAIDGLDASIWENWESENTPMSACDINTETKECEYHGEKLNEDGECPYQDETVEVYQWFAVNSNDADFLKRHNQYITYSDMLDTHFLAICHFGTSWDYTSMVDDFEDCYHGLDKLDDKKEVV
jgi:hypothetical protein